MSEQIVLRCEDSLEGIFTALFDAFVCKNKMKAPYTDSISIAAGEGEMTLFAREIEVQTDAQKVQKTVYSIQSRLGYPVYDTLLHALCHFEGDRGTAVLGYLVRAFAQGRGISDQLADPFALRVMELSRKVDNMVPLMMDHFSDRFPDENFILYDENRNLAAVHEAGHRCVLVSGEQLQIPQGHMDYFAVLWKQYFATMEIRERHNEQCQNHLLPKWYRKYMTEWN